MPIRASAAVEAECSPPSSLLCAPLPFLFTTVLPSKPSLSHPQPQQMMPQQPYGAPQMQQPQEQFAAPPQQVYAEQTCFR